MTVQEEVEQFIGGQPEPRRGEMQTLHELITRMLPSGKLWFDKGRNSDGKVVTNPTIGYGIQTVRYAGGNTREWFQIGLSPNTTGLSVYILGIADKAFLPLTYGKVIGKATVTGYCIRFRKLEDIRTNMLEAAIRDGIEATAEKIDNG